jgi:CubicO group peptidase (beta-lactamase class C family)
MKLKKIQTKHLYALLLIVFILSAAILSIVIFRKSEGPDISLPQLAVSDQQIDSVYSTLSDSEKIGLLLLVQANINDSNQFKLLTGTSKLLGISSFLTSTISFDYHKQISDSISVFSKAPLTYALHWHHQTPDTDLLPPFKQIAHIQDTAFMSHLSFSFKKMLNTYGINCIFLPQLFPDTLHQVPSLQLVNYYISASQEFFSKHFSPSSVVISGSSSIISLTDSSFYFPGDDLSALVLKNTGFSSINTPQQTSTKNMMIETYSNETDIQEFLQSSNNILLLDISEAQNVHEQLTQLSKQSSFQKAIIQKQREIIAVKLHIKQFNDSQKLTPMSHNSSAWQTIVMQMSEHIACLAKNKDNTLPLLSSGSLFIVANDCNVPYFHNEMKETFPNYGYSIIQTDPNLIQDAIVKQKSQQQTIVFIQDAAHRFDFDKTYIDSLSNKRKVLLIDFSDNYDVLGLNFHAVYFAGNTSNMAQQTAAKVVCGSTNARGTIYTDNKKQAFRSSETVDIVRLKPSFPEDAGLDGAFLHHTIDSIIQHAMASGAFPGCQVYGAKDGKIIFNKAYGFHSYDRGQRVQTTDLYDIASVTKVAAATIAAMHMCDRGRLSLNDPIKKYFKNTEINYTRIKPDTNVVVDTLNLNQVNLEKLIKEKKLPKDTFRIRDTLLVTIDSIFSKATPSLNIFTVPVRYMLMHYSGIAPTLPILPFIQLKKYWMRENNLTENDSLAKTVSQKDLWNIRYSEKRTDSSKVQIADNFYMKDRWLDSLWERTKEVGVSGKKYSQYTDLNMILVQIAIDTINKSNLDKYMLREFYIPLGMENTMYLPLNKKVARSRIAPTEFDKNWRRQVLRGHVHDPSAALLGGISGNAGLFSSASDLGILFHMLLNGGKYAGRSYLSQNIIKLFTTTQEETGRGIGFDKWGQKNIVAPSASPNTYGHTGFTGCCVWVDPEYKLVYVFLSNRVHPNVNNWKINGMKIRQNVHQAFYDAEIKVN